MKGFLGHRLSGPANGAARRALLEIVQVLRALLGALSAPTVLHFYVKVPPAPLPALLGALLPTTASLGADGGENARRALADVASLVSLVCLSVGEAATLKHLLPEIDRFFTQLAHLHRSSATETGGDAARRLAVDVARDLSLRRCRR